MEPTSIEVKLGVVKSQFGELHFTIAVYPDGTGHVRILALDPSNGYRKAGVMLTLGENGYQELKKMIAATDVNLEKIWRGGQLTALKP